MEKYIEKAKKVFKGKTLDLVLGQIEEFVKVNSLQQEIIQPKYKIGDEVLLPKGTLLHGIMEVKPVNPPKTEMEIFDFMAKNGVISASFTTDWESLVSYCGNFYRIRENKKLYDYIREYSGLTFTYKYHWSDKVDQYKVVPLGKIDDFVLSMRNTEHFCLNAETTMEARFLPSLARDKNQIAFILDASNKKYANLLKNNLDVNNLPDEIVNVFIAQKPDGTGQEPLWAERNANGHNARIAYIIFGLPPCMIEGVLVGRKAEKDAKMLNTIKQTLPNCYICNLDGKVIY